MRIGIDISQTAYEKTGVEEYLSNFVKSLIKSDKKNEYVLFFSSLRKRIQSSKFESQNPRVKIQSFPFPQSLLSFLWNKLHILRIEKLIGPVDVFITSDWTEPPARAKKVTIIYDLVVYKAFSETDRKIVETQRKKLEWVKKESDVVFCISEATKRDAMEILKIEEDRLKVIYPGI